uniref:Uncharacterized protein n=1 Tax=Arundo donax TaxID=35708 RepID=A0A0A9C4V6_ARUDO
MASMRLSPSSQ